MLDHLPIAMASPTTLAAIGAIVLLLGEIAALLSLPNLGWTFAISTVAELGYVLIGLGVGGPAGDTGALMHLGYQAAMRGLVLAAGWHLVRRTGSANLNALAGSGPRMPVATTLFGFGVFSVMGLSPFKGSSSSMRRSNRASGWSRSPARWRRSSPLSITSGSSRRSASSRPLDRSSSRRRPEPRWSSLGR
jgi:formate hydrogenlyase subunit 3/multisubunit Na+/H+ antiporter MnhD subunit